ncbi:hypothetical protein SHIRM173S_08859 [Streptomyces hirsutus]
MKVVHGRQGYASMALLLPDRPMEHNHADNARMLAEETPDTNGVVAIPGAPRVPRLPARAPARPGDLRRRPAVDRAHGRRGAGLPYVRVTAESVGASKPDPEGFLKGAAELGVAPPTASSSRTPGRGSPRVRAAGMRVVGIGPRAGFHDPDVVVRDLTQVRVERGEDGTILLHITDAGHTG